MPILDLERFCSHHIWSRCDIAILLFVSSELSRHELQSIQTIPSYTWWKLSHWHVGGVTSFQGIFGFHFDYYYACKKTHHICMMHPMIMIIWSFYFNISSINYENYGRKLNNYRFDYLCNYYSNELFLLCSCV